MEKLSGWELSIGRIKRILDETPGKQKIARRLFFCCSFESSNGKIMQEGLMSLPYKGLGESSGAGSLYYVLEEGYVDTREIYRNITPAGSVKQDPLPAYLRKLL